MRLRKKKSLIEQAGDYVESVVDAVRPQVEAALSEAREKAGPAIADARTKATPYLVEARERAVELSTEARDKAGPALADARRKAAPYVASGAAFASAKADELGDRASATLADANTAVSGKVAELKGEQPKKGSKLKKLLLIGGLAGVVAVVARKVQGGQDSSSWQSSYVPSPPPKAPAPVKPDVDASAVAGDDTGGSSPDEALADSADGAHEVTTPDDPATTVDLDGGAHKKK